MKSRFVVTICALALLAVTSAFAQSRDFRAERVVLDDNNGNTLIIQTPAGPITGGTLTIPDPGGAGQFLISNPSGGTQSVSGDFLPGADDTYDLGSGATRWQDIFGSGNVSIGGQARFIETGGGPDYVGFQAPVAVAANQIWTLPAADGTSGQALVTDGSGGLSWATAGGTVSSNATLTGDGSGGSPLGINLANGNTWTGLQQFNASFTILGNGRLALTNNDNNARDIRWQEPSGTGSQYVGLRAPTVAQNSNYVFPAAIGTAGQVLSVATVNGFGDSATLSWVSGGGTVTTNATLSGDGSGGSPLGINLSQSNTWTANQTFAGSFLITANSRIALTNSDNNARDIRWQEPSGTGSQYIGIRAPTVTQNSNYVFPASIGTAGQVLSLATVNGFGDSATLAWTTPGGGGAGNFSYTTINANTTLATSDELVGVNTTGGAVTVTLPAANSVSGGKVYIIHIEAGGNNVTIATSGTDTLVAANPPGTTINAGLGLPSAMFYSDGTGTWYRIVR